jgi:hypothetical protein
MKTFPYIRNSLQPIFTYDLLGTRKVTSGPWHSFPSRRPGFDPTSDHVRFVVDKVALGQVFSEYFGFSWQSSFPYKFIIRGWCNRAVRGRHTKWNQSHPTPTNPYKSIIRGWYSRPVRGRHTKWNQSHRTQTNKKQNKLRGFSPQANSTDQATAACRRI